MWRNTDTAEIPKCHPNPIWRPLWNVNSFKRILSWHDGNPREIITTPTNTTRIRVLRHSRLSNQRNKEALTLLCKENISHGVQKNDSNTNTNKTLPNDRNYFKLSRNTYCTRKKLTSAWFHKRCHKSRTSGLSGPSHANEQDRKPANKIDISANIVTALNIGTIDS